MFNENTWKDGELKTQEYMKRAGYKIIYASNILFFSDIFLLSSMPSIISSKGIITAHTQTGPASGPLPTSLQEMNT